MKDRKFWIILNILTLGAALVVNYLSVNLPLNGMTPREISDTFDVYFIPAGYVFSIWGLIYLGLLVFAVYQALPQQRSNPLLAKVDPWFVVSNIANSLWLVFFHYLYFLLALVMMVVLVVSISIIYATLEKDKERANKTWKWATEVPFGIYLGWITVATIANATQVLDYLNWDGFGIAPEIWFMITVLVAVVISALMSFKRKTLEFSLVFVWAFIGIAVKFPNVPVVAYSAWGGAIAVSVLAMLALTLKPIRKSG